MQCENYELGCGACHPRRRSRVECANIMCWNLSRTSSIPIA
jgi:hypothetical protein